MAVETTAATGAIAEAAKNATAKIGELTKDGLQKAAIAAKREAKEIAQSGQVYQDKKAALKERNEALAATTIATVNSVPALGQVAHVVDKIPGANKVVAAGIGAAENITPGKRKKAWDAMATEEARAAMHLDSVSMKAAAATTDAINSGGLDAAAAAQAAKGAAQIAQAKKQYDDSINKAAQEVMNGERKLRSKKDIVKQQGKDVFGLSQGMQGVSSSFSSSAKNQAELSVHNAIAKKQSAQNAIEHVEGEVVSKDLVAPQPKNEVTKVDQATGLNVVDGGPTQSRQMVNTVKQYGKQVAGQAKDKAVNYAKEKGSAYVAEHKDEWIEKGSKAASSALTKLADKATTMMANSPAK